MENNINNNTIQVFIKLGFRLYKETETRLMFTNNKMYINYPKR